MSLRGFKRDHAATEAAHFSDARSYVSLPKIIAGECTEPKPHLVLFGVDKGPIRAEVFRLDRIHWGGYNRCWKCGIIVYENEFCDDPSSQLMQPAGEWDHERNAPGTRCDDLGNARIACHQCHSERHPQTEFGRHEKIMRSHDELY